MRTETLDIKVLGQIYMDEVCAQWQPHVGQAMADVS
jgi:hypothetical protein